MPRIKGPVEKSLRLFSLCFLLYIGIRSSKFGTSISENEARKIENITLNYFVKIPAPPLIKDMCFKLG